LHGVPEQRERESAQHWRVCARTSRGWDGQQACFPCCPSSMLKQECFRGTGKRAAAALTLEKVITLENVLILVSVRRCACRWHTRVPGCHCAPCSVLFHHPEIVFITPKQATPMPSSPSPSRPLAPKPQE
jgi:hypothetical protein